MFFIKYVYQSKLNGSKVSNNYIGWIFDTKLIKVGYGINAKWVEIGQKINKRTPTIIRYSRVGMSTQRSSFYVGLIFLI